MSFLEEVRNPETSFERLKELVLHTDLEASRCLLEHPNLCPTNQNGEIKTYLLRELARKTPDEVAMHPVFVLHALIEPNDRNDSKPPPRL